MAKVTLGATIPTGQYANLQPNFEVESDTFEEAMDIAIRRMKGVWDRVAKEPLEIDRNRPEAPAGEVLRCRVSGAEVIFDPIFHTYHDRDGHRYMGGSTFAAQFKAPFAGQLIAGKMATKHGVDAQQILDMWKLNAEASSTFGTSVHAALQLYGEYLELSKSVKGSDESALTKNPVLRPIVEAFFTEERIENETAYYEEFVADAKTLRCGLIDRLTVDEDGLWIEDFKTSASMDKQETILPPFRDIVPNTALGAFWLQLSYYGSILVAHGRVVKGLRVHHWTGTQWDLYEHPLVDLSPAFQET